MLLQHVLRKVRIAIACAIFMLTSAAVNGNEPKQPPVLNPPLVWLPGDYFRAALVAFNDFKTEVEKHSQTGTDLERFLSKIENYLFAVELKNGNYLVGIGPKDMQGSPVLGGVQYVIDEKKFEIKKKLFIK